MPLTIPNTDIRHEIPDPRVWLPAALVVPDTPIRHEIPDFQVAKLPGTLSVSDTAIRHEIPDFQVAKLPGTLSVSDTTIRHEIPDPSITLTRNLAIPDTAVVHQIPDTTINVSRALKIANEALYHQIPDIWLWNGLGCVGFDSTREVISGLQVDGQAEYPTTELWWDEDLYKFTIRLPAMPYGKAMGISNLLNSFLHQELIITWPSDGANYSCILMADATVNQVSHSDDWAGEFVLIGRKISEAQVTQLIAAGVPELIK